MSLLLGGQVAFQECSPQSFMRIPSLGLNCRVLSPCIGCVNVIFREWRFTPAWGCLF